MMAQYFGGGHSVKEQKAGMRTAAMFFFQMQTMSRGEAPRNQRKCHRLNYTVDPGPDANGSLQLLAYTKDIGKTASGETKSVTAVARHRDLFQCAQTWHAVLGCQTWWVEDLRMDKWYWDVGPTHSSNAGARAPLPPGR
ncbi:hypothetical protein WJX82_011198 [Trebouxia sp. C0006]